MPEVVYNLYIWCIQCLALRTWISFNYASTTDLVETDC